MDYSDQRQVQKVAGDVSKPLPSFHFPSLSTILSTSLSNNSQATCHCDKTTWMFQLPPSPFILTISQAWVSNLQNEDDAQIILTGDMYKIP